MKLLTPKTRGAIIYDHNCRQLNYTIAKWLGCEKTTVNDIINHFCETHSLTLKKNPGYLPLLNSQVQQKLKALVTENSETCQLYSKKLATVWTAHTKQAISAVTIRRNLKKVGLTGCIPRKKPAMTEAHYQARLEQALAYENWGARRWR